MLSGSQWRFAQVMPLHVDKNMGRFSDIERNISLMNEALSLLVDPQVGNNTGSKSAFDNFNLFDSLSPSDFSQISNKLGENNTRQCNSRCLHDMEYQIVPGSDERQKATNRDADVDLSFFRSLISTDFNEAPHTTIAPIGEIPLDHPSYYYSLPLGPVFNFQLSNEDERQSSLESDWEEELITLNDEEEDELNEVYPIGDMDKNEY